MPPRLPRGRTNMHSVELRYPVSGINTEQTSEIMIPTALLQNANTQPMNTNQHTNQQVTGVDVPPEYFASLGNSVLNVSEDNSCYICYENFSENNQNDTFALPQCNHKFHSLCILQWFYSNSNNSNSCPYCRQVNDNSVSAQLTRNYDMDRSWMFRRIANQSKFQLLEKINKRRSAPVELKRAFSKYKLLKQKAEQMKRAQKEFLSRQDVKAIKKETRKYQTNLMRLRRKLGRTRMEIMVYPINPVYVKIETKRPTRRQHSTQSATQSATTTSNTVMSELSGMSTDRSLIGC